MPYKDPERRREYQRQYYRDRSTPRRKRNLSNEPLIFVTKSIRFEDDDYRNLIAQMLRENSRQGKPMELFNFSEMARSILFEWAGQRAIEARRARFEAAAQPAATPTEPAF